LIELTGIRMTGKWVGFGKDFEINAGPWELVLQDPSTSKATVEASADHSTRFTRSPTSGTRGAKFDPSLISTIMAELIATASRHQARAGGFAWWAGSMRALAVPGSGDSIEIGV